MTVRVFADTNLFIYAESADGMKTVRSLEIIEAKPVIRVQVINETVNVLTRKYNFTLTEAHDIAEGLLELRVTAFQLAMIQEAELQIPGSQAGALIVIHK